MKVVFQYILVKLNRSTELYLKLIIAGRIDEALENLVQDQFEILLYKKNSK